MMVVCAVICLPARPTCASRPNLGEKGGESVDVLAAITMVATLFATGILLGRLEWVLLAPWWGIIIPPFLLLVVLVTAITVNAVRDRADRRVEEGAKDPYTE